MKPPDFLVKGFTLSVNIWCESHKAITPHLLEVVGQGTKAVNVWKTCLECKHTHDTLKPLGVTKPDPRVADAIPTTEYVFLVLHPEDIIA